MSEFTIPSFYNLNLDLIKTQAWVPQTYFATAGDTGYVQQISLFLRGNPYTSATVNQLNFRAIKPDGNVIDITGGQGFQAVDGQANQFVFEIPKQTFAATGTVECYIYITNSDNSVVASTTHFFYKVLNSVSTQTGSISMIATLDDVVKQAHDLYAQAMSTMSEITATKTDTDTQATNFAVDLKQKQSDAEKQADQMLADVKAAMDKTAGDATDYQTKLDDLNKQYITKYNELLAQLPDANDAVQKKIGDALAQLKIDEQQKFDEISMDWVKQKETLSTAITAYENSVTKQLDDLKQQIGGISSEKVTKLSSDIDALQQKLASLKLSEYYTKKEIDDKLDSFQPKVDLSGYETTAHAEDTYAKKTDIVAPNLSAYETTAHASDTYETKEDAASHLTKTQADTSYASKSDIPDLSGYETKTDADATYAKKADIPASPDLSAYETVAHADETFAKKSDIVSPDLTDYAKIADVAKTYETKADASSHLTKTQADADYASKSDIPDVSGFETATHADATFAKKSDIPASQDLSSYETKEHASETYATKQDVTELNLSDYAKSADVAKTYETKADAATHLTKTDADATYAKKDDAKATVISVNDVDAGKNVAFMSSNAQNGIKLHAYPEPDGSVTHVQLYFPNIEDYLTKSDAESTYAKKSDVSGGTTTDLSEYLKKSDADNDYAKKSDIPDLSTYLTKAAADKVYAKKGESTGTTSENKLIAFSSRPNNDGTKNLWPITKNNSGYIDFSNDSFVYPSIYNLWPLGSLENAKKFSEDNSHYLTSYYGTFFIGGVELLTDKNTNLSNFATKDDLKNIGSGSSSSSVKTINIESPDTSDPSATNIWGTITIKPDSNGTVNIDRDTLYDAIFNHHSPVTSVTVKSSNGNNLTVDPDSVTGELQLDLSNYLTSSDANNTYAKTDDILQTTNKRYFGYCETSSEQDAIDQSNSQYPTITYFNGYIYIKGHKIKVEN